MYMCRYSVNGTERGVFAGLVFIFNGTLRGTGWHGITAGGEKGVEGNSRLKSVPSVGTRYAEIRR